MADRHFTVVFNVRGQIFEVLRSTIDKRPGTRLYNMSKGLDDPCRPIFVDANIQRFNHILDWYRYDEIFLPAYDSLAAVLRDAAYFRLGDSVIVNGQDHRISGEDKELSLRVANKMAADIESSVSAEWPECNHCVCAKIEQLMAHIKSAEYELWDWTKTFTDIPTYLYQDHCVAEVSRREQAWTWEDREQLCSHKRLCLLVHEIRRRGFECFVYPKYPSDSDSEACQVMLRLGLHLDGHLCTGNRPPSEPARVALEGVRVSRGLLWVRK